MGWTLPPHASVADHLPQVTEKLEAVVHLTPVAPSTFLGLPWTETTLTTFIGLLGALVALTTAAIAVAQYAKNARLSRYKQFLKQRIAYEARDDFLQLQDRILNEVDTSDVYIGSRVGLLVFFENVALFMNSRLLSKPIVHNTWGDTLIKLWKNVGFWQGIDPNWKDPEKRSRYWRVFYQLHSDINAFDKKVADDPKLGTRYRF